MAVRKKKKSNSDRKRKILGILLILLAVLLLISLVTHSAGDNYRIAAQDNPFKIDIKNQVGLVGAYSSYLLYFLFGWVALFIPFMLIITGLHYLDAGWRRKINSLFWLAFSFGILITMALDVYRISDSNYMTNYTETHGGYIIYNLTLLFLKIVGTVGSYFIIGAGIVILLIVLGHLCSVFSGFSLILNRINFKRLGGHAITILKNLTNWFLSLFRRKNKYNSDQTDDYDEIDQLEPASQPDPVVIYENEVESKNREDAAINKKSKNKVTLKKTAKPSGTTIGKSSDDYVFPQLDILEDNPDGEIMVNPDELTFTARALKETLETFGITIQGQIEKYPGPIITRYEFKPAAGVKINKIMNLSDDLALALKAKRIRIIAPIPGKAAVGVEIPNRRKKNVYLKEIIGSDTYADNRLRLPLALGKTISGKPYITDLTKMPHLLIAGATGSGKSVCINALIASLLYRLHSRDLKFIFIDPKMLELSVYAGIPYLGRPVVTNAKRAEKVLSDAVVEMEKRYKSLAGTSVRNIDDYNARQKKPEDRMAYIVIVIDELADMMLAASSSRIEMLLTRLAQMARAVGIHLILATQRPSVDVITGLIKANFSARIAFQVATKVDSRTILDCNGGEKLLGNGDMLFLPPGQPEPVRLHGAFISGIETERLVKHILDQVPEEEIVDGDKKEIDQTVEDAVDLDDPIFIEAAETVIRHKQGSVSLLQRKLGIGYQRAARLIDRLEEAKIVSTYDGSKAREVLVDQSYITKLLASRSLTGRNS